MGLQDLWDLVLALLSPPQARILDPAWPLPDWDLSKLFPFLACNLHTGLKMKTTCHTTLPVLGGQGNSP